VCCVIVAGDAFRLGAAVGPPVAGLRRAGWCTVWGVLPPKSTSPSLPVASASGRVAGRAPPPSSSPRRFGIMTSGPPSEDASGDGVLVEEGVVRKIEPRALAGGAHAVTTVTSETLKAYGAVYA